jgi:hypothetical protein
MKNGLQILAFTLLVALAGCKGCREKDPEPPKLPNPSFETGEEVGWAFFPTDTVDLFPKEPTGTVRNCYITFWASDATMDKYEWTIGTDERKFTNRKFTLYFDRTNQLTVKLKVFKNGRADSLTKQLILRNAWRPKIAGIWEANSPEKPDSTFKVYILNGLISGYDGGAVDTLPNWPTPLWGYEYIISGFDGSGSYRRFTIVTNGGMNFKGRGTYNNEEYGDSITVSWRGNNQIKFRFSSKTSPSLGQFNYFKKEYFAKKLKW